MYHVRNDESRQLLSIIRRLDRAREGHDIRPRIAKDILRLLGADFFCSYLWDEARSRFDDPVSVNISAAGLRSYEDYYQFRDPITPRMRWRRRATEISAVLSRDEVAGTEIYNDFLSREGMLVGINLFLYDGDRNIGDLRIFRSSKTEFGERGVTLLEILKPHLARAIQTARYHGDAGVQWRRLWDHHPHPCFILDRNGAVLARNRALDEQLAADAVGELATLLAAQPEGSAEGGVWRDCTVTIIGIDARGPDNGDRLVCLTPRRERPIIDRRWLRDGFALTEREAEVCLLALKGLADREIADALDLSIWTVRTHLQRVYLKVEVAGRSELGLAVGSRFASFSW